LHPLPLTLVQPGGTAAASPLFEASSAICPLPRLAEAAGASAFLNAAPDSDGILRRAPLTIAFDDRAYPSLGLAAAMRQLRATSAELRVLNANATALTVGERRLPLDGRANLLLRFRGRRRTFPFVSATDVVQGRVSGDTIRGRLVFVGATALGTQELVATPHDPQFIGVEVQATVADNILQGDVFHRPVDAQLIEAVATVAGAGAVAVVVARGGLLWGGAFSLGSVLVFYVGALMLAAHWALLLSPVWPSVAVVLSDALLSLAVFRGAARAAATDMRRARADAQAMVHAHQDFLSTLSRELRTPLSAIRGYAQMLARGAAADPRKAQTLAAIERHAVAQTRVIDDLLEASRSAAGQVRLEIEDVDLASIVRSVVEGFRVAVEARQQTLTFYADDAVGHVAADGRRLRQVVWHLISNAVKFTPQGGRIDVELALEAGAAQLVVRDTGAGIPAETLAQLFVTPIRPAMPPRPGGLGLGLSLVRHIVELHGGEVSGWSSGPGAGTTFRVSLPVARPELRHLASAAPVPPLDGKRIVVLDERAGARGQMAATLLAAGASVVTAASVPEALGLVRDDSRDVLVVNVGTSDRTGYWLAREALAVALNRGEHLAIVAIVPPGHFDTHGWPPEIGIERHLTAPVDASDLVSAIAEVTHAPTAIRPT